MSELLPYASNELGRFSLKYDSLSSAGADYDLNEGSVDFYYSMSLINEFDVNRSMYDQEYISLNGLIPYDIVSKASFFFQNEMNSSLRGKIDRKNMLEAYSLINLDFIKRDFPDTYKSSVVGEVRGSIDERLLLSAEEGASPSLSLYMAGVLSDIEKHGKELKYAVVKDVIKKTAMYNYMDLSVLPYCKGRSLSKSEWIDIASWSDFPKRFPFMCSTFEQMVLVHITPRVDTILAMDVSRMSLEEAIASSGLSRYLFDDYLSRQYGPDNKRVISRTYLANSLLEGNVHRNSIQESISSNPFNNNVGLASSILEQGLISQSKIVKIANYLNQLDRDVKHDKALSALIIASPTVTIVDKVWRNCESNQFVGFDLSCATIKQDVYIGYIPSALDVAEGDVSPLHAYYLNWLLSKGLMTSSEARSFLHRYANYIKSTH
ncbi:hypothetical protein [Alteromonas gracilis]|uniref:hypothetical protein n=1 Tax=Alteromonas gracilis TaxID=1479524 RepID=UPI0037350A6B